MAEHLLGQREIRAQQEGRPVDRVEADDVLADKMKVGGPELVPHLTAIGIAEAGDVIGQRIDPNIHDVAVAAGHFHAPVEAGPAHRQILQPALDEGHHFIAAADGFEEARCVQQFEQRLGIARQAEEPGLFLGPFDRSPLRGQLFAPLAFDQFFLVVIGFVTNRVPAFVAIEVEIALGLHCLPDRLAGAMMIGVCRADEAVVRDVQCIEQILEVPRHLVRQFARGLAQVACLLGHLQTMLVGPCLEPHFASAQALEAGDDIGRDRFIGMADMRLAIGIVDRGGKVVGFSHWPAR